MTLLANDHVSLFALGPKKRRILPGAQLVCLLCPLLLTTPAFAQETEPVDGPEYVWELGEYTWEEAAPYLDAGYYCESLDVDWEDCTDLLTRVDHFRAFLNILVDGGYEASGAEQRARYFSEEGLTIEEVRCMLRGGCCQVGCDGMWCPEGDRLVGDLNGDDSVDVVDVQILINFILTDPLRRDQSLLCPYDLNGDGTVDRADLDRLLEHALRFRAIDGRSSG